MARDPEMAQIIFEVDKETKERLMDCLGYVGLTQKEFFKQKVEKYLAKVEPMIKKQTLPPDGKEIF